MAPEEQRNLNQTRSGNAGAAQRLGGVAPYVNHRAPNGPPVMPEAPQLGNGVKPSTAVQATYRPNFTMGGNADSTINTTAKVVPDAPAATDVRAKYNPANGSPEAKAWQAQRAAASAPAPTAPAAATAATPQGVGYRAGSAAGRLAGPVLKAAGAVAGPALMLEAAGTAGNTPTSNYETRFGFGPNTNDGVAGLARDVGVRSLGVASDLGNAMTFGQAGKYLFADKQNPPATASQAAAERLSGKPNQQEVTQAPGVPEQTAAAALPNSQTGQISYDAATKTYSGTNVGAGAQIVNGRGGGAISAQNMQAANELAADQQRASVSRLASIGNVPQSPQRSMMIAPTVSHSGNDFSARKQLENLKTSASSITNTARWGGRNAERNPSVIAYQQALQADLAAQGKQPDMDMQTMGLNAGMAREQIHQDGANTRAAMGERTAAQRLAMDGRRLAGEEETRGFHSRQAQRLEDAQEEYLQAQTDEGRGVAHKRLAALMGKSEERNLSNNFMKRKVPTLDKEGRVVGEQEELVDLRTGAPLGASGTGNAPVKVTTPEQLNALPAGSVYVGPDGKQYQKG